MVFFPVAGSRLASTQSNSRISTSIDHSPPWKLSVSVRRTSPMGAMMQQFFYLYILSATRLLCETYLPVRSGHFPARKRFLSATRKPNRKLLGILRRGSVTLESQKMPEFFRIFSLDSQRPGTYLPLYRKSIVVDTI